jgi:hypothetical protein
MKKKILIITSLLLLLLLSSILIADGVKNDWTTIHVRGQIMVVYNESSEPVAVRWDYFTVDEEGNYVVLTKAPGAYNNAFDDSSYYYFYDDENDLDEFIVQHNEEFVIPRSVWNVYVEASTDRVKRGYWKKGFTQKEDESDEFIEDNTGLSISIFD